MRDGLGGFLSAGMGRWMSKILKGTGCLSITVIISNLHGLFSQGTICKREAFFK